MVAKSPSRDVCHPFDKMRDQSLLLKQTVHKVDRAMARLREIQSTVGGIYPVSARGCRLSLRSARESTRRVTAGSNATKSPQTDSNISPGEWRRWSLPAALVEQAVGEILEASHFAKVIVGIFSLQDPNAPQNDVNLVEEQKKREILSVPRNDCSEHWNFNGNATQSTPPTKCQSVTSCLQNGMNGLESESAEKKAFNRKCRKVAPHKFRMITPENKVKALSAPAASSSLQLQRRAEKRQVRARAKAELLQAGTRVKTQMNFHTSSNCADKYRKNVKAVASALVSCYNSPARSIPEQKTLLKVDQITPPRKPWVFHPKPVKTIIFPNPAFIPSPSDSRSNVGKFSKKGFSTPKLNVFSTSGKENVPLTRKMGASSTLSTKSIKGHSSSLKLPTKTPSRMIKQASIASRPTRNAPPSTTNQKSPFKVTKFFSPSKIKSPKHCSSSKKPIWFHRQRIHSPVQPLPSLISKLPSRRNRNSILMPNTHVDLSKKFESCSMEDDAPNDSIATRLLPLPPARLKKLPMDFIKDNCIKPMNPKSLNLCVNEIPHKSHYVDQGRSISCPKQRPVELIENSSKGIIDKISASQAEFCARRSEQRLEGKENNICSEAEEHDLTVQRRNGILRRRWSFGHEKSGGAAFPLFNYARGWANKNASNTNR